MNATTYFRAPFRSICYSNKLIEYTIMEMDMIANANNGGGGGANFRQSQKVSQCLMFSHLSSLFCFFIAA